MMGTRVQSLYEAVSRAADDKGEAPLLEADFYCRALRKNLGPRQMEFVLSTGGIKADGFEIIQKGWDTSRFRPNARVLWVHQAALPPVAKGVEEWLASNKQFGTHLRGVGEFLQADENPMAEQLFRMYERDSMAAVSVRWNPKNGRWSEITEEEFTKAGLEYPLWGGARFHESYLKEWSMVPLPGDENALRVREFGGEDFVAFVRGPKFPALPEGRQLIRLSNYKPKMVDAKIFVDLARNLPAEADEAERLTPVDELVVTDTNSVIAALVGRASYPDADNAAEAVLKLGLSVMTPPVEDGAYWRFEQPGQWKPEALPTVVLDGDVVLERRVPIASDERTASALPGVSPEPTPAICAKSLPTERESLAGLSARVAAAAAHTEDRAIMQLVPHRDTEVAPLDYAWDPAGARARGLQWASRDGSGAVEQVDWDRYAQLFAERPVEPTDLAGYRGCHHDIVNGKLTLIPQALQAVAQRLLQGQLSVDLDAHLDKEFARCGQRAPWDTAQGQIYSFVHGQLTTAKAAELPTLRQQAEELAERIWGQGRLPEAWREYETPFGDAALWDQVAAAILAHRTTRAHEEDNPLGETIAALGRCFHDLWYREQLAVGIVEAVAAAAGVTGNYLSRDGQLAILARLTPTVGITETQIPEVAVTTPEVDPAHFERLRAALAKRKAALKPDSKTPETSASPPRFRLLDGIRERIKREAAVAASHSNDPPDEVA